MAELYVIACLLTTKECSERPIPGGKEQSVAACMKTAKHKAEEWQKSNTQYVVIGQKCKKI